MLVVLVLNNSRPSISLRIVGVGLRSHAAIRSAVPVAWLAHLCATFRDLSGRKPWAERHTKFRCNWKA